MSLIVDEHRAYLSDTVRVDSFRRAIDATVRPGDVVVDIGSGTGILGFLACRAGARKVYAIESSGMIEIARALARANGFEDRMVFVNHHSAEAVLPELADVLVADLIGGMGFEVGLFPVYNDARRFLKAGGRVIPARITLAAAPVEEAELFEDVQFWSRRCHGLDIGPVMRWAANTGYPRRLDPGSLLSQEVVSTTADPCDGDRLLRLKGSVDVIRAGTLHGICGWFDAELAPGVRMTNSPLAASRLPRRNVFLPLDRAARVAPGDTVAINIRIRPWDLVVSWDVEVTAGGERRQERHSTLNGMLLSRNELGSQVPHACPRLTPRGVARRSVLELCDGARTLKAIEDEVFRRHPDLFPAVGEAQAFVAEVVANYSEQDA
jgi:protein arginine N-methyltransferase 1